MNQRWGSFTTVTWGLREVSSGRAMGAAQSTCPLSSWEWDAVRPATRDGMNRKTALLLAVFALGCAAGMHVDSRAHAQAFPTPAKAQKWQQECAEYDNDLKDVNRLLRARGEQGWELVAFTSWGSMSGGSMVACFKRPAE